MKKKIEETKRNKNMNNNVLYIYIKLFIIGMKLVHFDAPFLDSLALWYGYDLESENQC